MILQDFVRLELSKQHKFPDHNDNKGTHCTIYRHHQNT